MKSANCLSVVRLVAVFFILYVALASPRSANAESTVFSESAPWYLGQVNSGQVTTGQCQNLANLYNTLNGQGRYFTSPLEAETVCAVAFNSAPLYFQYDGYSTGYPTYGFGLSGAPYGCNDQEIDTWVVYKGTNYGMVCADGSYVEGGQTCSCGCSQINKGLGSSCGHQGGCQAGDPVDLATGNLYEETTDYVSAGDNPLVFTRYYNSLGNTNASPTMLGHNWRTTYDRRLRIISSNGTNTSVVIERADGQELVFFYQFGVWNTDTDVDTKLAWSGANWIVTNTDDTVETYNSGSSGTALLTSIRSRNGYTQTLQYDGSNHLITVTDSFGRVLQFNYNILNHLNTVTAPSGLVITYTDFSDGVLTGVIDDRLKSVSFSSAPQTTQTFAYENPQFPYALTGIIDENGNRYSTWSYDSAGRANSSQHAGGAELTKITYNADGSCSVTNALGATMVYKFSTSQNIPKLTEIDRLATKTSPAASRTFGYDQNGYLQISTDWNTNYNYAANDSHGQPLTVSESAYSQISRNTTLTYLANFHLPAKIVIPNKTTSFNYDTNGDVLTRTETDNSTQNVPYSTSGQTRIWTNTFDSFGHLLSATGPRTDVTAVTSFAYDSSNNLTSVTDPLGHLSRLTNYNGSGLPVTMIDPNGVVTAFTYDMRDRLLSRVVQAASGNATNLFAYDAAGQLITVTLPDGSFLGYQYDAAHRLQSVSNSLGETISYQLDAMGNITNRTIRNAGTSITKTQSRVFDQLGRMLKDIGASAQTTAYALGAQPGVGGSFTTSKQVELDIAPYSFGNAHKYHSGEFRSDNMQRTLFWNEVLVQMRLKN